MSTRAYKIIEIKTEKEPTFNFNENRIVMLADDPNESILTYQKENIEEELKEVIEEIADPENQDPLCQNELEDIKITLEQMIEDCGDDGYVEYYCY